MKTVNQILANDRNPDDATLKQEFVRKLKGHPTEREIRQAMMQATSVSVIQGLLEMSEKLNES